MSTSTATANTTKRPSFFSRFSSSASSIRSKSTSSSSSTTPAGCRDYNRYAKDGKGFDFNASYPYSTTSTADSKPNSDADSESEASLTSSTVPLGARDFKLRYAKDGKGHDFSDTYTLAPANYAMNLGMGGLGDAYIVSSVPRGSSRMGQKSGNMRYAWHQGRQAS